MYPDLSYLFNDLFGTEVDNWTSIFKSFGFMLGMAFLASGLLVKSELKRLENIGVISAIKIKGETGKYTYGDLLINILITMVILAKLPYIISNFDVFKADPASVIFSKLGNWPIGIIGALAFGAYTYYTKMVKQTATTNAVETIVHPHQKAVDIIFIAAISGVIGARLFSILENMSSFLADPIGVLFSGSGLTIYGGIIVAFIAVYYFVKKNGIKPVYVMDIAGMGILLGYAIGRIGCQISGDGDWGIVAAAQPDWWFLPEWLWSYNYPNNVNNEGTPLAGCNLEIYNSTRAIIEERCKEACGMRYCHQLTEPVYPTPIYETTLSLIGFGLLYLFKNRIKVPGLLFFLYMIYNGTERFFIENIRVNDKYELLGMNFSQAQYISIGFVIVGLLGLVLLPKYTKERYP
jgi:phosphatidylglycerol---prolipoprotein diacylglyceryl transferase